MRLYLSSLALLVGVIAGCADDSDACERGEVGCGCWYDDPDVDSDGDGSGDDETPAHLDPDGCEPGAQCDGLPPDGVCVAE